MQNGDPPSSLSEREREILIHVANGLTNKEIAVLLQISTNTVKVHLRNIFSKIGATTRTEAALVAIKSGMVSNIQVTTELDNGYLAGENEQTGGKTDLSPAAFEPAKPVLWKKPWFASLVSTVAILAVIGLLYMNQVLSDATPSVMEPQSAQQPSWETLPDPGLVPLSGGFSVINQTVFVISGEIDGTPSNIVRSLDMISGEWHTRAAKPIPAADLQAGVIGGKIYLPGGRDADGMVLDVLEIFDPIRDSWSSGNPMPEPRSNYSLAVLDGSLYVLGGWDGLDVISSTLQYNPQTDEWRQLTPLPEPIMQAAAVVVSGKIYLLGGQNQKGSISSGWVFQMNDDGGYWEDKVRLPSLANTLCAASIIEFLYAFGSPMNKNDQSAWLFTVNTNEWTSFQAPDLDLSTCQAAAAGTHLFVMAQDPNDGRPVIQTIQAIYTTHFPNLERP